MDAMNMAVYASAMLKQLNDCTYSRSRAAERCEPRPGSGLGTLARFATAVGAVAALLLYASR